MKTTAKFWAIIIVLGFVCAFFARKWQESEKRFRDERELRVQAELDLLWWQALAGEYKLKIHQSVHGKPAN